MSGILTPARPATVMLTAIAAAMMIPSKALAKPAPHEGKWLVTSVVTRGPASGVLPAKATDNDE